MLPRHGLLLVALTASACAQPSSVDPISNTDSAARTSPATTSAPSSSSALADDVAPPVGTHVPNWTFNGSDPQRGQMVLRCENAFPPEDKSGTCKCEGYALNPCADGVRTLVIDRKQCAFVCKPTSQDAKKITLRCPDGTNPEASTSGCACSGRKPMDPCAGGIASARSYAGGELCQVTCTKGQ